MLRGIMLTRSQVTDQQLITAKTYSGKNSSGHSNHEKTAFLFSVNRIIGRVKIQNQFFGVSLNEAMNCSTITS